MVVAVLVWLCVIEAPTVLNWPLKVIPPVFCTVIVSDSAVSDAVLLNLTPSSSKNGPLELMTGVTVTPPVPATAAFTVREIVVVCVSVPLTPVMVIVAAPSVAVLEAVNVRVLVLVVEAGLKAAVTPAGNPLALSATLPANPPEGVTVMVLVPVAPRVTAALVPDKAKLGTWTAVTVKLMVAVCVRVPLTPVTVMVAAPRVAVLDAVKVRVLVPVVEAGLKAVVTPAGNPLAVKATAPVNPPDGVTVRTLEPVAPCATETLAGLAANVKLGVCTAVTVKLRVAVCVRVPLTPVTVTVAAPRVAVLEAVKVRVLALVVVEAGLKLAVTPAGNPLAVSATAPVNPLSRVTVIALVAVPPWATLALAAAKEKSGVAVPVTVTAMVAL